LPLDREQLGLEPFGTVFDPEAQTRRELTAEVLVAERLWAERRINRRALPVCAGASRAGSMVPYFREEKKGKRHHEHCSRDRKRPRGKVVSKVI
jgi:hypothetical protein